MRGILLSAGLILASAGIAHGDDAAMSSFFGNTVIAKSAMGESHTHYKADHSFDGSASSMMGSMQLKGTWKFDEKGELCRTYDTAMPGMPNPLCTAFEPHKVGDTWTMMGRTISLVAGIQ
jgi:hypothetical protein